ncbi:hypothetical protein BJ878DRAFT_429828 [Calycina marina]|uniref:Uncharacterized protein n=1 Tax=Calycina marina TaxID=1763456 RepID=A0A9P8CCV2_9HELO|nr:hypothetical protein BJ878DRAFT_429828 [Calycina marina]
MRALLLLVLATLGHAAPAPTSSYLFARADKDATSIILAAAPASSSCSGGDFPEECRTAQQAMPFLTKAFADYKIYSVPEIAAVLSLIAFESDDFKFNINHYPAPGRPGQGTRNMQMPNFNLQYTLSVSPDAVKKITTATSTEGLSDAVLNSIRDIVTTDQFTWASGAWFLVNHCASVRPAIQKGDEAGFEAYMDCIGTAVTDDRLQKWKAAMTAFGLSV